MKRPIGGSSISRLIAASSWSRSCSASGLPVKRRRDGIAAARRGTFDRQRVERVPPSNPFGCQSPRSCNSSSGSSSSRTSFTVVSDRSTWPPSRPSSGAPPRARRARRSPRCRTPRPCGSRPHAHFARAATPHPRRALRGGGRAHGGRRLREDEEEAVALPVDLDPVVRLHRPRTRLVVQREYLLVALAPELAQHPRRAFDVGEEKVTVPTGRAVVSTIRLRRYSRRRPAATVFIRRRGLAKQPVALREERRAVDQRAHVLTRVCPLR